MKRLLALLVLIGGCTQPRRELEAPKDVAVQRLLIDTRLPAEFAAGHDPGAINLQWDWDQLADRVEAYVPDHSTPLALRATNADEAALAAGLLAEHGYVDVTLPVQVDNSGTLATMTAAELAAAISEGTSMVILDVREPWEHAVQTIPGAILVDPDEAPALLDKLSSQTHYAVICEGGYRSSQMASLMQQKGLTATNVIDGMAGWRALPKDALPEEN